MRKDNPAVIACDNKEKGGGIHNWIRRADGTAYCTNCAVELNQVDTMDCFDDQAPAEPVTRRAVYPGDRSK